MYVYHTLVDRMHIRSILRAVCTTIVRCMENREYVRMYHCRMYALCMYYCSMYHIRMYEVPMYVWSMYA